MKKRLNFYLRSKEGNTILISILDIVKTEKTDRKLRLFNSQDDYVGSLSLDLLKSNVKVTYNYVTKIGGTRCIDYFININ